MKNEKLNNGDSYQMFVVKDAILEQYNGSDENVRLPGFVSVVGSCSFKGNNSVRKVCLSSNTKRICEYAFSGCKSLEKIEMPYELAEIGDYAFSGCISLREIVFHGSKERWRGIKKGEKWFDNTGEFVITCKDGIISKQEEIEIESEPKVDPNLFNRRDEEEFTVAPDEERRKYLERRRRELIARIKADMDSDDEDDDNEDDLFSFDNEEQMSDEELKHEALKLSIQAGVASVSMFQRKLPIGYIKACKLLDWLKSEGYVSQGGTASTPCKVLITGEEFEKVFGKSSNEDDGKHKSISDKLLYKLSKKEAMRDLATVLSRIALKKQGGVTVNEMPYNSLWEDKDEFDNAVMERLERLVRSDLKMARRGAAR